MNRANLTTFALGAVSVEFLQPESAVLEDVRQLWRENSAWLGFFPKGAFQEYASQNGILGAIDSSGRLLGYLAFRRSQQRVIIVHLCVGASARGKGIARVLVEELVRGTSSLLGASLTCRTDFAASRMWPKFGFVVVKEVLAKKPGRTLTRWWLDYGHPDLFSGSQGRPVAVLDANVFFDLASPTELHNDESAAITADWLTDAFTLSLTPEVFNEIARSSDSVARERNRLFADGFHRTVGYGDGWNQLIGQLSSRFGRPVSFSDESDLRQLAHAIDGGASYFVTRDDNLLKHSASIASDYEIRVLRPAALVTTHDAVIRPHAYSPIRLDGSSLFIRHAKAEEEKDLIISFQHYALGETKAELTRGLRSCMVRPQVNDVEVVLDDNSNFLALIATSKQEHCERVELLRYASGGLADSLTRHLLWRCILRAWHNKTLFVEFADKHASDSVAEALADLGFARLGSNWQKPLLQGQFNIDTLLADRKEQLLTLRRFDSLASSQPAAMEGERRRNAVALLERHVWPAQLRGELSTFVIPIRAHWASELFDTVAASERLFEGDTGLLLRFENAYYRAARPKVLRAPGRILWYVSRDASRRSRSGVITAASLLNEVRVGTARELFRAYKRYGVFSWEEVRQLSPDLKGHIMAFTFSHTLLFPRPIPFEQAFALLHSRTGKSYRFQSPLELDEESWMSLYGLGFRRVSS